MEAVGSSGDQTVFHYDDYLQYSGLHAAYTECSDILIFRHNKTKRTHIRVVQKIPEVLFLLNCFLNKGGNF